MPQVVLELVLGYLKWNRDFLCTQAWQCEANLASYLSHI